MIFEHSRGGVIKLGAESLEAVRAFEQHKPDDAEAGGVLLGRRIRGAHDVVVDQVTVPMQGDERSRYGFHRDAEAHQREVDLAWQTSGGACSYLGEWHTHPEPVPTPSSIDLNDWSRRLQNDTFDGDALYFVIVGQREICVWEGDRRTGTIVKLAPKLRQRGAIASA